MTDDYRHFISRDWAEPYRQRRANQLLREVDRHPVYGMIVMQADNLTGSTPTTCFRCCSRARRATPRAARVHELMSRWNRFMLASRPEPLIYTAWLWELQRGILADELGETLQAMAAPDVPLLLRIIRDKPGWCDDGGTRQTETCEDQIALALDRALDWIARAPGTRHGHVAMGREHLAVHRHPLFDSACRCCATSRRSASPPTAARQTLNCAQPSYRGSRPFDAVHGAGYRGVYDFSDLDNSRFAMPLGQSGNMLSPWARNFVEGWQKLGYVEIAGTRAEVGRTAIGTITLSPPAR